MRTTGLCLEIGVPVKVFYPDERNLTLIEEAKAICSNCGVKDECLDQALKKHEFGIWGGTTEDERRALRLNVFLKESLSNSSLHNTQHEQQHLEHASPSYPSRISDSRSVS